MGLKKIVPFLFQQLAEAILFLVNNHEQQSNKTEDLNSFMGIRSYA